VAGPHRILVVDDEEGLVKLFRKALQTDERAVLTAMNGRDALALFRAERPELVILDLKLPDRDGMAILREMVEITPETSVIILTAHGNTSTTIEAMRLGAYDYITKPFDLLKVKIIVDKALEKQALKREIDSLRRQLTGAPPTDRLMGQHPAMQQVYKMIGQVADTDAAVLIRGETGTGKELVARTIHESSRRRDNALVAVDCASFAETLLESELFGHERGSFTGAFKRKLGKFELAHRGTLFLDEIGNVSTGVQAKLLRFLQEKSIERVGGTETIEVDTRIIAATSLDIEEAVKRRQFREDLFYRLNVVPIRLPPLRERRADIPILAEHFLRFYSTSRRGEALHFAPAVLNCLLNYSWPGNVRQLQNVIERAVVTTQGSVITLDNLPPEVRGQGPEPEGAGALPEAPGLDEGRSFDEAVEDFERNVLRHALEQTNWNQTSAARMLGMSFRAMRYRVKKYGLKTSETDQDEEPASETSPADTPRQDG
jgi:DNA-binding NtrC family response regulator